jgi:AcrR family transcriptional regulator
MVAQAPVPRPGGRSARVRSAVLDATLDELVDHGYAAMTIHGIARRAGVNKTSLYRRWGTKGALLAEALASMSPDAPAPPDTGDVRTDLLVLWSTAPPPRRPGDFARPVAVSRALAAADSDPAVAAAHHLLWQRRLELIKVVVERAVSRGQLPPEADPELLMDLLFGPFHTRVIARGQRPSLRFLTQVMEAALHAVGAGPPPSATIGASGSSSSAGPAVRLDPAGD